MSDLVSRFGCEHLSTDVLGHIWEEPKSPVLATQNKCIIACMFDGRITIKFYFSGHYHKISKSALVKFITSR